jgi:hypothetical protein
MSDGAELRPVESAQALPLAAQPPAPRSHMYPTQTLSAEVQRRALTDPVVNRALQELLEKGRC